MRERGLGGRLHYLLVQMLLVFIVLLGVEMVLLGSLPATFQWIERHMVQFVLNYVLLMTVFLFVLSLLNDALWSIFLTALLTWLPAGLSRAKFGYLGDYLFPWDFMLMDQLADLFPSLFKNVSILQMFLLLLMSGASAGAIIILKQCFPLLRRKLRISVRIALFAVSVGIASAFVFPQHSPVANLYAKLEVTNYNWDQPTNVRTNGFLLSFVMNTQNALIFPPREYSKDHILRIVKDIEGGLGSRSGDGDNVENAGGSPAKEVFSPEEARKPNIIMVMNEAFWDPSLLGGNKPLLAVDPMPAVRKHQSGWLLSPQFGGGTANVEFEALTGLTVSFLPGGSIAYQQYVKRQVPSLASILAEEGYKTIGVHPYHKWFWERVDVYPLLGFQRFVGLEEFEGAERRGPYVADAEVSKRIIREVEEADDPVFIYAVTMQNHGPYEPKRYGASDSAADLKVSGDLTEATRSVLDSYTQGIRDADQALGDLIDYFSGAPGTGSEPTIVVFYGDHLPYLGKDYAAYKELGFVPKGSGEAGWSLQDYLKMRSTPLVIWSNYAGGIGKLPSGVLSASFLGPVLFDLAGLEKPLYFKFLEDFSDRMPGYTSKIKVDADGNMFGDGEEAAGDFKHLEEMYRQLQYDILFGGQYAIPELF